MCFDYVFDAHGKLIRRDSGDVCAVQCGGENTRQKRTDSRLAM